MAAGVRTMSSLAVYMNEQFAGRVDTATLMFRYEPSYLQQIHKTPLSVRVPLTGGAHNVEAWLDGLLPDSDTVRRRWSERHGARSARPVDLLASPVGLDCAGAVRFCSLEHAESLPERPSGIEWLTDDEIEHWIKQARLDWSHWDGLGKHGQVSLGGAQAKCALRRSGHRWGAPFGNAATTHILKPGLEDLEAAEVVEHICMAAARAVGLDAADTSVEHFGDERVIVVERFDRMVRDGRVLRLHQEDLCQALGVKPDLKYQADGGPGPVEVAELLRRESVAPQKDLLKFCDALIYSWAIAAPDAHAKNYSLTLHEGRVRLAPLYDIASFLPYSQQTPAWKLRTAMRVGRDYTLRKADRVEAWRRTAESLGLGSEEVLARSADLVRRIPEAVAAVIEALDRRDRAEAAVALLARRVSARCRELGRIFSPGPVYRPWQNGSVTAVARASVPCEQTLGASDDARCGRRLLMKPCPLHPDSPGSRSVQQSDKNPPESPSKL